MSRFFNDEDFFFDTSTRTNFEKKNRPSPHLNMLQFSNSQTPSFFCMKSRAFLLFGRLLYCSGVHSYHYFDPRLSNLLS